MITQGLLDFFSLWCAGMLALIPPLPGEWGSAIAGVADAGAYFGSLLANLGPVVPWNTIGNVIQWWIASLTFWAAMLGLRLVLWIIGR